MHSGVDSRTKLYPLSHLLQPHLRNYYNFKDERVSPRLKSNLAYGSSAIVFIVTFVESI